VRLFSTRLAKLALQSCSCQLASVVVNSCECCPMIPKLARPETALVKK
jgi:hypothetical protein